MVGRAYRICAATPPDARALLDLKRTLDDETDFMLLEPGEREETPDDLGEQLRRLLDRGNSTLLLAGEKSTTSSSATSRLRVAATGRTGTAPTS